MIFFEVKQTENSRPARMYGCGRPSREKQMGRLESRGVKRATGSATLVVCAVLLTGFAALQPRSDRIKENDMVTLENPSISVSFSSRTGAITGFVDRLKDHAFIRADEAADPFRLDWNDRLSGEFESFTFEADSSYQEGDAYVLRWCVREGITVTGRIQLPREGNEVRFYSSLENQGEEVVFSLEYPVIPNLLPISSGGRRDYLAHSFATGFLIHNPSRNFVYQGAGLRFMPYPEGFSGATMQFFTFYEEGGSGLYFATYDGDFHSKWLNFYKGENELLEASFMHANEDMGPRKGMSTEYPVVIRTLERGDWYEAADIYKKWAYAQIWCERGPLVQVPDDLKATWLLEEVGLSTFGIDAQHDRSAWIREYRRLAGTPVFHILGPDWVASGQDYVGRRPGGLADWFPARFNEKNMAAIRANGDRMAPFELDYTTTISRTDSVPLKKALQIFPSEIHSIDKYNFHFVCPVVEFISNLLSEKDVILARDYGVDATYFDISANNVIKICLDPDHGHPVGAGSYLTHAYRENYRRISRAMQEASGRYLPMGTEMVNEVFVDLVDYYQARAGAQPAAAFEGYNLRKLLKKGEAELIPMFTYVYHEYGSLRLDGWGKLVEEIGELFYFTVARIYLWGGIYELNYEYSPHEILGGREPPPDEHYFPFTPRGYELSPERGAYVSQFAKLRTGRGNRYLAYGAMQRPLDIMSKRIDLEWFHYNCNQRWSEYNDSGSHEVNSIINSVWKYRDESLGIFVANVSMQSEEIELRIDLNVYDIEAEDLILWLSDGESERELPARREGSVLTTAVTVGARQVLMLEAKL